MNSITYRIIIRFSFRRLIFEGYFDLNNDEENIKGISVIVPLYNKGKYIQGTLDRLISVVSCSPFKNNYEIIVVDDGSTDDSYKVVSEINCSNITLFKKDNNGVSSARNYGIEKATKEYLVFLDADDCLHYNFMHFLFHAFSAFPQANLFGGAYEIVNIIDDKSYIDSTYKYDAFIEQEFFRSWYDKMSFCSSSVCIKKSFIVQNSISFPIGENNGEDQFFWFRCAALDDFILTKSVSCYYLKGDSNALTANFVLDIGPHLKFLKKMILNRSYENRKDFKYIYKIYKREYANVVASNIRKSNYKRAFSLFFNEPTSVLNNYGLIKIVLSFLPSKGYIFMKNSFLYFKKRIV